ncbi:hypothetical protein GP486_004261, partial [Trichoglossum hirsutum]
MRSSLIRIPFTGPLPPPRIVPTNANTPTGAIAALTTFLTAPPSPTLSTTYGETHNDVTATTVILSGAGISVASGLADYRGARGTYTLNRTYRPIYYSEAHDDTERSMALDVDSFHPIAHPDLPTVELHGYLRFVTCLSCHTLLSRADFQNALSTLNPAWAAFLEEVISSGTLDTENTAERRTRGIKTNPDGDIDVPGAPYSTFRYPPCSKCLAAPPTGADGRPMRVDTDRD